MTEEIKKKSASRRTKRKLTRKEAIKKGNKEFKTFTRDLAKAMNTIEEKKYKK